MYVVGQKVCLWDVEYDVTTNAVLVKREFIVTITETKTGVPGEFSRRPMLDFCQSLRAVTQDGRVFEKHWDSWPESQTNDFQSTWTWQEDNGDFWIPTEAVYEYDSISQSRKKNPGLRLLGIDGQPTVPKGDRVVYCKKHDRYSYKSESRESCFMCFAERNRSERVENVVVPHP